MNQSSMNSSSIFLFKTVLGRTVEFIVPNLREQLIKTQTSLAAVFETFPRQSTEYATIISSLAEVAAFDVPSILKFLTDCLLSVFSSKIPRQFRNIFELVVEYDPRNKMHASFATHYQAIFFTDLICTILVENENETKIKCLVDTAYKICTVATVQPIIADTILPQWAVIISHVSKNNLKLIYETFSQLNINKPEMYFSLFKYIRFSDDEQLNNDFCEIMYDYVDHCKRKKLLTGRMLSSLSIFFLTFHGDNTILHQFKKIATLYLEDEKLKYGAIELMCALLPMVTKDEQEIRDFYEKHVFTIIQEEEGFPVAVQALYILIFGRNVDPDWFFWEWGPNSRKSAIELVSTHTIDEYFSGAFMRHYFQSQYFHSCGSEINYILLYIASQNFRKFREKVTPEFLKSNDNGKFSIFLSVVPLINDEEFCARSKISKADLQEFNNKLAEVTHSRLQIFASECKFGVSTKYNLEDAAKEVEGVYSKWEANPGPRSQPLPRETANKSSIEENINMQLMEIIPFIIGSDIFTLQDWINLLICLAAIDDSHVSATAIRLIEQNLDTPELYADICTKIVKMVTLNEDPEIVFICLQMLLFAAQGQEPKDDSSFDALADEIEFTAFLGLASEKPEIRDVAYQLLIEANKLQRNDGIFANIEKNVSAIESNVKQSVMQTLFPAKPGVQIYKEKDLHIEAALKSPYQQPWLYFLAEFSRISRTKPIFKRIKELSKYFLKWEHSHMTLGVMVIFVSSCVLRENQVVGTELYATRETETNETDEINMDLLCSLSDIIKTLLSGQYNNNRFVFTALKYTNYSVVPFALEHIKNVQVVDTMQAVIVANTLMKTIEEHHDLRRRSLVHVSQILSRAEGLLTKKKPEELKLCGTALLSYLSLLTAYIDTDDFFNNAKEWSVAQKASILYFLVKLFDEKYEWDTKLQMYASNALVYLLSENPPFTPAEIPQESIGMILKSLQWPEEHNFYVLKYMLGNNVDMFLRPFIDRGFSQDQVVSDMFFVPISDAIFESLKAGTPLTPYFQHVDSLIILGLYKIKTGISMAKKFVIEFSLAFAKEYYPRVVEPLKAEFKLQQPNEALAKHMIKKCEAIVQEAFRRMLSDSFDGSVKVIADILIPWIQNFRLLPKLSVCIPNMNSVVNRMSPAEFLEMLTSFSNRFKKDFESVCDLWATLINAQDHIEIIPNYIEECPYPELKKELFLNLLPRFPEIIIQRLVARCRFSFYAYIEYQMERDIDDEMWFVSVLIKAIRTFPAITKQYLPVILQFALLFHANQTQSLYKRLCKQNKIQFSRRTLSRESLVFIVDRFREVFKQEDAEEQIDKWAMEAARWVIGSKNLKTATIALVILNRIQKFRPSPDPTELFSGMCRSVSYFLQKIDKADPATYEFINETFVVFDNHFEGREQFALSYLSAFFEFVINVDAYFDSMIPLFLKCKESPVTRDEASKYLMSAIRPIFNELESDAKALEIFNNLAEKEHSVDIDYVRVVLRPLDGHIEKVQELIENSTIAERNRALGHYSFMQLTASNDMMRRIFTVSSLILRNFVTERENIQNILKNSKSALEAHQLESSSLATASLAPHAEISEMFLQRLKMDLNKQALVSIFNAALKRVTTSKEALKFICDISHIDPLIPNVSLSDGHPWDQASEAVVKILDTLFETDNEIVTLTDCDHLNSTSNLLSEESRPQILPFTTRHEMIESMKGISGPQAQPILHIAKWVKALTDASFSFQKGVSAMISPSTQIIDGEFVELKVPMKLKNDDELIAPKESLNYLCTAQEFINLGIVVRRPTTPKW